MGLVHVVGRAVALGLVAVPAFNARVLAGRVRPLPRVDVGFAVDVQRGRDLAPLVVRHADQLTTTAIAERVGAGAAAVRAGRDRGFRTSHRWAAATPWPLLPALLRGVGWWNGGLGLPAFGQPGRPLGGAVVSDVGSLGLDEAVLAPVPFARACLWVSVGRVHDAVAAVGGEAVVRPTVVLTATADHRVVDGAHAGQLAGVLRELLTHRLDDLDRLDG